MRHWFRKKDGRPRTAGMLFDDAVVMLEERVMLDAVPTVTVVGAQGGTGTAATQSVLLKSPSGNFTQTFEFANTSGDNTVGYGPYIELIVPKLGTDGSFATPANNDGLTFNSATYLGSPVTAVVNTTFDAAGHATNTLTGEVVNGTPGQEFVVLQLPFGSYTPPQTPADIVVNFTLSDHADLGIGLAIQARGGFEFGNTPTGNPATQHIVNPTFGTSDTITPTLLMVTKSDSAPNNKEAEVGTGPNQPLTYTISVDVAEGQTLTNIDVTDLLPASAHFLSATIASGTGTITATPTVTAADVGVDTTGGHNTLTAHFNSVTGTASASDAQITVSFYVAKTTFAGASVIDPTTGATTLTTNQASATATWHPIDPLDSDTTFTVMSNVDTIQNQPIVIQKTETIVNDTGTAGLSPGDTLQYTLNIQVSDYFTLGNLSLNDVLRDGQRLDTSFAPTLSVVERGVTLTSGAMAGVTVGAVATGDFTTGNEFAGNFASTFSATTGTTTNAIDISSALAGHPGFLGVVGVISGGRVTSNAAGTTIQVTFRTIVQNNYENNAQQVAGTQAVDQGDTVGNDVVLSGSIRSNTNANTVLNATSMIDDAASSLTIAKGSLIKSVYAINGDTNLADFIVNGQTQIKAGDIITYRLEYDLPISSFQNLFFNDFLPLPVLVAQGLTLTTPATPATAPANNLFSYGPNDTYHTLANSTVPGETFDASGNSVKFTYPDYSIQNNAPPNANTHVDLLFSLKVQDTAFADGLFLTNLATSNESNTVGNAANSNGIVQIQLAQPNLLIQKAIVSATAGGVATGTITTPQSVAGLTFGAAGTASSFTDTSGPLTDTRLGLTQPKDTKAAPNIDSNVTGLDGGDIARVALTINNEGGNDAFDVKFGDTLPTGVAFAGGTIDAAASHLVIRRGDGTPLVLNTDYTITGNTATSFQITLANNYAGHNGAGIGKDGVTDGSDILLVTYDVAIASAVTISPTILTSNGTINNFAALPTGTDISLTDPLDAATIALAPPGVAKAIVVGSSTSPSTTEPALTIGEQQSYTVTYTLPEGTLTGIKLSDLLPGSASEGRYEIVSATINTIGANLKQIDGTTAVDTAYIGTVALSNSHGGTFNGNPINDTATFGGGGLTIVNVADNTVTSDDKITITYVVRAIDHVDNTNGDSGNNVGQLTYSGTTVTSNPAAISIALPDLNIAKSLDTPVGSIDAGDTVTFTVTVNHVNGTPNAYDIDIADILPTGLSNLALVAASASGTGSLSGFSNADFSVAGGNLHLATPLGSMSGTDSFTVKVTATVDNTVPAGSTLTNSAGVTYSTLSGVVAGERTITETSPANVPIAPTALVKSIQTTSVGGDADPHVLVGEVVTFYLTATLSEGTTNNFNITDTIPAGLVFVSGQVVSIGGSTNAGDNFGGKVTGSSLTIGQTVGTPAFSFGTVSDTVDNNAQGAADQIVVQVVARIDNSVAFTNGQNILNKGFATSTVGGTTISQESDKAVIVDIPNLTINKTVTSGTHDAGDPITYTIVVAHDSTTVDAHDVTISDVLPTDFTGYVISSITASGGLTAPTGAIAGGILTTSSIATMTGSQSFTVTITSTVANTAVSGTSIANTARVDYSSLAGVDANEGSYFTTSSASLPIGTPTVAKQIATTSVGGDTSSTVFVGETVTFNVTATLAEGTTNGLIISDLLPAGLTFVSGQVLSIGGSTTAGANSGGNITGSSLTIGQTSGTPSFSFGTVVNAGDGVVDANDRIVVQIVALVDKTSGAVVNGATLSDRGRVSWTAGGTQTATTPNVDVIVAIPHVTIAKSVVGSGPFDAGDTVTYDIVVTHDSTTTDAHDVSISQDNLPLGFTVGTATVLGTTGGLTAPTVSVVAGNLTTSTVDTMTASQSFTVRVTGTLTNAITTGVPLSNMANLTYSTLLGTSANELVLTDFSTANFTPSGTQAIVKTITGTSVAATGTSQGGPGPDLVVGETGNFQIVVTLPEGTTNSVVISDILQNALAHLALQGTPTVTFGAGITSTSGTAAAITTAGPTLSGTGFSYNFGTIVVPGDNDTTNNTITITYTALLDDVPANIAGNQPSPIATLTSALGTQNDAKPFDIVQPNVTIGETVNNTTTAASGDTVTYTATLANTTGSTADAQDVVVTDLLGNGATFIGGTVLVNGTPTAVTTSGSGFTLHLPSIALGATTTVVYQANVSAAAQSTVTNTAQVDYDGIPSGVGVSGTDGQNDRDQSHSASASLGTVGIVKSITTTSLADTGTAQVRAGVQDLAIGETATFQVVVDVPAGARTFTVKDLLDMTGVGQLTLTGTPVVTKTGGVSFATAPVITNPDNNGDGNPDYSIAFSMAGGSAAGQITITYTAVVPNVVANTAGDQLDLPVTLAYATPASGIVGNLTSSVSADIVEPTLSILKSVVAGTPNAGDTVSYTVTITNTGTGPAYDLLIADPAPAGLAYGGATLVVGGVTTNPGSAAAVSILSFLPGQTATLTYTATVGASVVVGSTVPNTATLTSTSLPLVSAAERIEPTITSSASFVTEATQAFTKTIFTTSDPNTTAAAYRAGVPDLAIGETATIDLQVNLSEGTTNGVVITDFLTSAVGTLTYVPGSAVLQTLNGGAVTGTVTPTFIDDNADGIPDRIVFTLGNVTIPGDNVAGNNFIVVRYQASPGNRPENATGDAIDLTATLTSALGTLTDAKGVDLVEPLLVIDKQIATSDPTPNAGDTVTYTVIVTNNGTGPAYAVNIADPLPAGLTYSGAPSLVVAGVTSTPPSAASVTIATLLPGQTATLTYSATIDNTAVTGVPINNTATVASSGTTPGGGGRPGPTPSDSTSFVVEALQGLDKAISATSDPNTGTGAFRAGVPDLHIGETATVDLTVRLTEGTTGSVVLVDKLQLPAGTLTLTAPPTIITSNGITFTGTGAAGYTLTDTDGDGVPDTITMNFGTVTVPGNNDRTDNFFVVRYTGVVGDRPENQAGNHIDLGATLTTALGSAAAATQIDVVAPAVTLAKSAAAGFVSRGDTVNYTITLTNSGTGPAYDLGLADVLPAGLSYVANTTTLTVGGVTTSFASPNAVTFAMLGSGQTGVVNYQVLVDPAVAAAASYTNTATVGFDSLSGPGGRAGTASGTATISTPTNVIALSKSIVSTTIPDTGTAQFRPGVTDLNVGEHAVIDLTASFTEGATNTVVLTDQLPLTGKFQLVGTPTITFLGGTTSTVPGTATLVDTDGDGLADKITFNFGTVTVPVDGDPTNNLIRIRYEIVTPDVATNVAGAALSSPALLTTASGNASAGILADIVAPNVGITKAVSAGTADAGDVKAYTVTIANNGSGPAFDLTIADTLPAGLTAVSGTTVLTVGGVSTSFASPASIPIASLGVGQSAVLTFNAVIGDGVVAGSTLTNGASVSYDSLAGPGGHPGSAAATASFTTAAVQTLDKTIVATSEAFTDTQFVRPTVTDLTIGERATFELATTFSEGTTNNVVITDQLVTANGVLTFSGTPTLILGAGITITGSVTPQFVDTNGDGVPDQVRFNLGNVTVPGNNVATDNFVRIRYDATVANVTTNAAGNQVALPAVLMSSTGSLTAAAPADIVAPSLTIAKILAPDQPTDGQHTDFLITVGHAAGSTAAATNLVLTEMLPPGALLSGAVVVSGPAGIVINGNVITIPLLRLGETVTVRITTALDFANTPTGDTVNMASVAFGTTTAGPPGGRTISGITASAILPFGNPTTTLPGMLDQQEQQEFNSMGSYLDARFVEDFPEIDPVYSGSATPGTAITIDVSDNNGSLSGLGTGTADAGGNWLVRLPSTTVSDRLERSRFDHYYDGSRLFRSPNGELFDTRSLLGFSRLGDRLSVGSQPSQATQVVRISVGGQSGGFDTSFAPAWRDQFFSMEPGLSVGGVFRDRAGNAVEGLLEGLTSPEAAGLNRFNREFLTTADF